MSHLEDAHSCRLNNTYGRYIFNVARVKMYDSDGDYQSELIMTREIRWRKNGMDSGGVGRATSRRPPDRAEGE